MPRLHDDSSGVVTNGTRESFPEDFRPQPGVIRFVHLFMTRRLAQLSLLLIGFAAPAARAAAPAWIEIHSEHFTLVTDGGDKDGRHLLDQLERMRWAFATMFPKANVDPAAPIVVIAVRNEKEFQTLEPAAYLGKGMAHLGGYFLKAPDKNYILLRTDTEGPHPYSIIYHEYTHLELGTEGMPVWLNEGLAQYFENTEFREKDVLLGEPSMDLMETLKQNSMIPLDTLFRVDANSPYYHEEQKVTVFYPESWALTHLLMSEDFKDHVNRIGNYLNLVNQHVDPVTAAQQAFGDLKKLWSQLNDYTNRMSYEELRLNSAAAPIDERAMTAAPISPTQVDAVRADVLAYVGRTTEASTVLDAVLKADPNNLQAHETMGYLAQRDGKMDVAKKWYSEAVDLDSQSFLAQYYFGALSLMQGDTSQATEASLRKAIKLNPRFAPAYDALAVLLARRRDNLDDAHMMSVSAVELEPQTTQYRMDAAYVLMQMNRYDDALRVLEQAKVVAKTPLEADAVQTRIAQLEQFRQNMERINQQNAQVQTTVVANGQRMASSPSPSEDAAPKHPREKPHGPMLTAVGTIHGVTCSYPVVLEMQLVGPKGTVQLYNDNYYDIDFSAANFTPQGDLHPCQDIEGLKAKVQYFATADKTVDGQIVSVELSK
jgi:tetratricopeptide (TPR) repeat protein